MDAKNGTANDIELDLFSNLNNDSEVQNHATTTLDPADAFVAKSIHPPSATPDYAGIPTNDTRSQVVTQYVSVGINQTPIIADGAMLRRVVPSDLATFNYALLHTSGGNVLAIPFVFNSVTGDMQQDFANVDYVTAYDFNNFHDDATTYRPVYKSTTTYLNATAFNDTGLVAGMQFNPSLLFAGTIVTMSHQQSEVFYEFIELYHNNNARQVVDRKHPDFAECAIRFAAFPSYIRDEIRKRLAIRDDEVPTLDPNTTIQVVNFGRVNQGNSPVPSPTQMMNQSTRAYTGKAVDGTFTVQRLNTIAPAWLTAGNTNDAVTNGLYQCYYYYKDAAGVPHFVAFGGNTLPGPTSAIQTLLDTLWSTDMTWAWTFYQGLSMNLQASASFSLLIKKYYLGLEIQPAPVSAWAGLCKLAPKPNLKAMQALMDANYDLKDCMPCKYNFWGTLASIAGSAIPSIVEAITKKSDTTASKDSATNKSARRPRPQQRAAPSMAAIEGGMDRMRVGTRRPPARVQAARMPQQQPRRRLRTAPMIGPQFPGAGRQRVIVDPRLRPLGPNNHGLTPPGQFRPVYSRRAAAAARNNRLY